MADDDYKVEVTIDQQNGERTLIAMASKTCRIRIDKTNHNLVVSGGSDVMTIDYSPNHTDEKSFIVGMCVGVVFSIGVVVLKNTLVK